MDSKGLLPLSVCLSLALILSFVTLMLSAAHCSLSSRLDISVSVGGSEGSAVFWATRGQGGGSRWGLGSDSRKGPHLCSNGVSRLNAQGQPGDRTVTEPGGLVQRVGGHKESWACLPLPAFPSSFSPALLSLLGPLLISGVPLPSVVSGSGGGL